MKARSKGRDSGPAEAQGSFIKFLGTAGARVVVSKQLRASGGIWLSLAGTQLHLDPGPGALVRSLASRPRLDPSRLDAILLSHKHLDHAGDINVMIEAMTEGGFKKRGTLFLPRDALEGDSPLLKYTLDFVKEVVVLEENTLYRLGEVEFSTARRHLHPVETYGFNFRLPGGLMLSLISDTRFYPELAKDYAAAVMVINVVRHEMSAAHPVDHLTLCEAKSLIEEAHPRLAILNHFGMTMLRAKPWEVAERLKEETGVEVLAARDGMTLPLPP